MPYPNFPSDVPTDKIDSCVNKVMAQGHDKSSAIAICYSALVEGRTTEGVPLDTLIPFLVESKDIIDVQAKKRQSMNPIEKLWEQIRELFASHLPMPTDEFEHCEHCKRKRTLKEAEQIVMRQADGKLRWFGVAATAVLNHDNMIDSRALFDSFIAEIERTKQYPLYDVLHLGEHCVVGQADYVFRDGAVYFASGTFNDDEFSQAVARELEANPTYWGHSIEFLSGEPRQEIIYDYQVPVFVEGINQFISVVPRSRAASMFTDVAVQQRGKTMMTEQQYQELVKLVGEPLAQKKRDELAQLNRTIEEAGLIQRTTEQPKTETSKAEEPNPAPASATPVAEQRAEEPNPAEEVVTPTAPDSIELLRQEIGALNAKLDALIVSDNQMREAQTKLTERIAQVEKPIEEILADAPEPKPSNITRAKIVRANGTAKVDPTETLEKLHAQRNGH